MDAIAHVSDAVQTTLLQLRVVTTKDVAVNTRNTAVVPIIILQLAVLIMRAACVTHSNSAVVQMALLSLRDLEIWVCFESAFYARRILSVNSLGCGCSYSEFGCCSDDKTPAQGPNYAGCDCASSKYGCCPDGQTEAQGENFDGCTDIPENLQGMFYY